MSDSSVTTGRNAIIAVQRYVESDWMSRWHVVSAENDDGIDGIVLLRKKKLVRKKLRRKKKPPKKNQKAKEKFTTLPIRGVLFVQVKGGEGYAKVSKKRPDFIEINLGKKYIDAHRPRWNALPGPVVLVYVDTVNKKQNLDAWWTDLRDNSSYPKANKNVVLIPRNQRFGAHSKGDIRRLLGHLQYDEKEQEITATDADVSYIKLTEPLKKSAQQFYRAWASLPAQDRINPKLGEIHVSRVGWRHITRSGRRRERIVQSLLLLGVAKRIVSEIGNVGWLGRMSERQLKNGALQTRELLGIRAMVSFPQRQASLVQVILERKRVVNATGVTDRVWFYSVYEARRGARK